MRHIGSVTPTTRVVPRSESGRACSAMPGPTTSAHAAKIVDSAAADGPPNDRVSRSSGLPLVFLLKTLIPLFAVMLALQGVAQAARALAVLFPHPVKRGESAEDRRFEAGKGHL